ncbi:MAG: M20 metallopeptidase family protein [Chloroflexota bacterium]
MLDKTRALSGRLAHIRHTIHAYPELGFQEVRTAELIADYLRELGLPFRTGVAKTGIIAYLGAGRPTVMLRADMDALQMQEANPVAYASTRPGLMHACGHDAHVACLLGAATVLAQNPPKGQVQFLFQPSEEGADEEGKHGGRRVWEEGYVEDLDAVFALHVSPELPTGTVAVLGGTVSSASDRFRGAILGRSCHGAHPEEGLDAIMLAGSVVNAINHIVSRRVPARESAVVTIGTINGGTRHNIVAGRVDLTGTLRSYAPAIREQLIADLERAFRVAETLGGGYELHFDRGPASVVNDEPLVDLVREVGTGLAGQGNVLVDKPMMGSEDFSFLAKNAPGCFFRLGVGFPGEAASRILHSQNLDVNDEALPLGAAMLAGVATEFLRRQAEGAK